MHPLFQQGKVVAQKGGFGQGNVFFQLSGRNAEDLRNIGKIVLIQAVYEGSIKFFVENEGVSLIIQTQNKIDSFFFRYMYQPG